MANDLEKPRPPVALTPGGGAADLIDRYVYEVARHLPYRTRLDIAEELHSLLGDALEERERSDDRPADTAMAVDVLRAFGEPETVAARYQAPRSLIGPEWYPSFLYVASIVVTIVCGLGLLRLAVRFIAGTATGWGALADALSGIARGGFAWIAIAVIVFAILERTTAAPKTTPGVGADAWDPRDLPPIDEAASDAEPDRDRIQRAIWLSVMLLILLNGFPRWLGIFTGHQYHYAIVPLSDLGILLPVPLVNVFGGGVLLMNLLLWRKGRWLRSLRWAELGLGILGGAILAVTIAGAGPIRAESPWFSVEHLHGLRRAAMAALWVMLAWQVWQTGIRLVRLAAGR